MKRRYFPLFFIALLTCFSLVFSAQADELDAIYQLADEKKLDQALKRLDTLLQKNPKDAQARFLQGLIFTEMNQRDKAIEVFHKMGKDFPDLPEPFNNLAVLYAERGLYDEASEALKGALGIQPDYATAHENLGDIYAKLASQSYLQAMQLKGSNAATARKLQLMKQLFSMPPTPSAPSATKKASPIKTKRPPLKKELSPSLNASRVEVEQTVRAWALAWSSKKIKHYLSFYADDFHPPSDFANKKAWEKKRYKVFSNAKTIRVSLDDLTLNMLNENRAQATFLQSYWSPTYQDKVKKKLTLKKVGNNWKIIREYSDG